MVIDPRSFGPLEVKALNDFTAPSQTQQIANLAALQAAFNAAVQSGGGTIVLPPGRIDVYGTWLWQKNAGNTPNPDLGNWVGDAVRLLGAGRDQTKIIQNHPTAPLVRITNFSDWAIEDLSLFGRGSITAGDCLQAYNSPVWQLRNVNLGFCAGKGFYNFDSERGNSDNLTAYGCRMGVVHFGSECYYCDTKIISPGFITDEIGGSPLCVSVNSSNGTTINTSGAVVQEKHAGLVIGGAENASFKGGSIKVTQALAGARVVTAGVCSLKNFYIEGYPVNGIPTPNPSVIIGGAFERFTTSAAMAATDLVATVADSSWSILRYNDSTDFGPPYCYIIYEPSNPAVFECVAAYGFIGNVLQIAPGGRGASWNGVATTPQVWAAGATIREVIGSTGAANSFSLPNPSPTLADLHLVSFNNLGACTLSADPTQGQTNGQIILGWTFDEWATSTNMPGSQSGASLILQGEINWMGSGRQCAIEVHRWGNILNVDAFNNINFATGVAPAHTLNDAYFCAVNYTGPDGQAQVSPTQLGYSWSFAYSAMGGYQINSSQDIMLATPGGSLDLDVHANLFWKSANGGGLEFHVAGGGDEMVNVLPLGSTEFPNFEMPLMISAKVPPYTPPAGSAFLYVDPADGKLKAMDSTGTVTVLTPV